MASWCWWGFPKDADHAVRLGQERRKRGAHGPHRADEVSHPFDRPGSVLATKTKILFRALGEIKLEEVVLEIGREYVCNAQFRGRIMSEIDGKFTGGGVRQMLLNSLQSKMARNMPLDFATVKKVARHINPL